MHIPVVDRPTDPEAGAFPRWLAQVLPIAGDAVDLGTGTGRVALDVAPQATQVLGIDIDASSLEAARWDAGRRGITNARFVKADAETADLRALNDGRGFLLATARLFLSPRLVPRIAAALDPGGHAVLEALDAENWNEAGGSRFNLAAADVAVLFGSTGLDVREACIERSVQALPDARAAQAHLKARRLWAKWRTDGRWETLRASLRRGGTLTESRFVFLVRRT